MNRKGLGIVIILVLVVLVAIAAVAVFIFAGDEIFGESSNETGGEGLNDAERPSEIEIDSCSDYLNETECVSDLAGLGGCIWDSNSSTCIIEIVVEENETMENSFDLAATDLNLTQDICTEKVNSSVIVHCNMTITGTIKNVGVSAIDQEFNVQFIDGSDSLMILDSFTITESLNPGAEKSFEYKYLDLMPANYFIKIFADSRNSIDEVDEDNNDIVESINLR
jgi:archaellin